MSAPHMNSRMYTAHCPLPRQHPCGTGFQADSWNSPCKQRGSIIPHSTVTHGPRSKPPLWSACLTLLSSDLDVCAHSISFFCSVSPRGSPTATPSPSSLCFFCLNSSRVCGRPYRIQFLLLWVALSSTLWILCIRLLA